MYHLPIYLSTHTHTHTQQRFSYSIPEAQLDAHLRRAGEGGSDAAVALRQRQPKPHDQRSCSELRSVRPYESRQALHLPAAGAGILDLEYIA